MKNFKNKVISLLKSFFLISIRNKKYKGKYLFKKNLGIISAININSFFSYHLRPKFADDIEVAQDQNTEVQKIAIIVQGPIVKENNFTFETIKLYRKIFPKNKIILSTWENEKIEEFEKLNYKNLIIIKSKLPEEAGYLNINYQIKSTKSAIEKSKEFNEIEYLIKSRTDCRIYDPNSLSHLLNLIKNFPVTENDFLNFRILANSSSTCKYRIYGLTDIFQFGEKNDLFNYWDIPYYEKVLLDKQYNINEDPIINETPILSEIFLCSYFLYKNKYDISWSMEDWWEVCRKFFIVIDDKSIDLFWCKHSPEIEYKFMKTYSENYPRSLSFNDWLKLYFNNYEEWSLIDNKEKWVYSDNEFIQISC